MCDLSTGAPWDTAARGWLLSLRAYHTMLPLLAPWLSWWPQFLSLRTIWIFLESIHTQPFYLPWEHRASRLGAGRSHYSRPAWPKAPLSTSTHLASLSLFLVLESEAGRKVYRWTPRSQCGYPYFSTLITILFQGWTVITANEQHDNLQP